MKRLFLFFISIICMDAVCAQTDSVQTDEAFLVETFFEGRTRKDTKVYVAKECGISRICVGFHNILDFYQIWMDISAES